MSNSVVTFLHGVKVRKPHIRIVRDAYATKNAKPWACSQAGFIARGATPGHAYTALMQAFEGSSVPLTCMGIYRR